MIRFANAMDDDGILFIVLLLAVIFGCQLVWRWWRGNEWKRQSRKPRD